MISNLNTDGSAVSMAHVQQTGTTAASPARPAQGRGASALPQLTRFGPDVWAASSSDPAKAPYKVERLAGGTLRCSCEGNATWGRECRHIKAVRASIPAPAPAPVFMCIECGQYPAKGESVLCRHCADLHEVVGNSLPVDEADVPVEQSPIYLETRRAVISDTPFVDEMRRLAAERHAAALAAPVGTFTLLASNPYSDLFD